MNYGDLRSLWKRRQVHSHRDLLSFLFKFYKITAVPTLAAAGKRSSWFYFTNQAYQLSRLDRLSVKSDKRANCMTIFSMQQII